MSESYPRKYWWAILIAVPVIVAIVGIVPQLIPSGGSSGSSTFNLEGAEFQEAVTMIDTQVIMEQIQEGPEKEELEALVERAVNLSRTGFRDEAIEIFRSLAERTESPEVFNNLGALYAAQGQRDAALAAYREGLARQPDSESLTLNLARLYAQENRTQDALAVLDNVPSGAAARALRNELTSSVDSGHSEIEPNEDANRPSPIALGLSVAGRLSAESDIDFFAFDAAALPRDWTRVRVHSLSPSLKLRARVFNPDKSLLWRNADYASQVTAGQDVQRDFVLQPDAPYFVAVSSFESAGAYELTVENLALFDRYEPNDVPISATAIEMGDTLEANVMDEGDIDHFRVERAGNVSVALENLSATLKPQVTVYDGDRRELWRNADYSSQVTAGQNIRTNAASEQPATYYIRVGSLEGRGAYRLVLTTN